MNPRNPIPMPAPPPFRTTLTYVAQRGDALWTPARRVQAVSSEAFYRANASVLEAPARMHGYGGGGHRFFPSTPLIFMR